MKLSDLKPNPQNPRTISEDKLKMLQASLEEFGDLSGFVYNVKTKRLCGGHQRQKVLPKDSQIIIEKKYSKATKTGTVAEGFVDINGEHHKYRAVSWDDIKEKAANIAANQHGGDWDFKLLSEWVLEIDQHNFPLANLGFDDVQLANLMAPLKINEKELDENIHTDKECPSCGYKWK